jgi:hypothetical protein
VANGSTDERIARADRIVEQSRKAQERAEQHRKGTVNAIAAVRRAQLPSYTDENEISEVTIGKEGVKAKAPPWTLLGLALLALAAFMAWLRFR